jgi:hypothetical protein
MNYALKTNRVLDTEMRINYLIFRSSFPRLDCELRKGLVSPYQAFSIANIHSLWVLLKLFIGIAHGIIRLIVIWLEGDNLSDSSYANDLQWNSQR